MGNNILGKILNHTEGQRGRQVGADCEELGGNVLGKLGPAAFSSRTVRGGGDTSDKVMFWRKWRVDIVPLLRRER